MAVAIERFSFKYTNDVMLMQRYQQILSQTGFEVQAPFYDIAIFEPMW